MNSTSPPFTQEAVSTTGDRILFFIKSKGPTSTATLAKALDMTSEAARQQVQKLLAQGLIEGRQDPASGVGRPRQSWAMTEAGYGRFPDTHSHLTVQLIGSIRQLFGEDGLDQLINQREVQTLADYRHACAHLPLPERLVRLAQLRTDEGYMARIEQDQDDWLLIEEHCPICAAARTCQGFCRSELQLFQTLLKDCALVQRSEHLFNDARRCVYRIKAIAL